MREIKFRVWCNNKKEFENDPCMIDEAGSIFQVYKGRFIPCSRETHIVEQYTGLKDKNGVDIYRNDIVEAFKHNETRFVYEVTERAGVLWFGNWNWIEFQNIFRNLKVIGNIHQNPELLEELDQ